ncbi:hypothetical protein PUN28_012552 [Cardiocondyla obscurior]|uniref:Uncharacterized protein n=1 Tax=Cardiocondyla obscurior TaxID=286306 RepID=A0AAW2FHS3_9HYME
MHVQRLTLHARWKDCTVESICFCRKTRQITHALSIREESFLVIDLFSRRDAILVKRHASGIAARENISAESCSRAVPRRRKRARASSAKKDETPRVRRSRGKLGFRGTGKAVELSRQTFALPIPPLSFLVPRRASN